MNLHVNHYRGVNGELPVPVIENYLDRISNLHWKDRKRVGCGRGEGGPNMPWNQGEIPPKEVLQMMKGKKYKFPASIEYEYDTPAGSDELTEIKKGVQLFESALA